MNGVALFFGYIVLFILALIAAAGILLLIGVLAVTLIDCLDKKSWSPLTKLLWKKELVHEDFKSRVDSLIHYVDILDETIRENSSQELILYYSKNAKELGDWVKKLENLRN